MGTWDFYNTIKDEHKPKIAKDISQNSSKTLRIENELITLTKIELERRPPITARIELGSIKQSPSVMNCKIKTNPSAQKA